MTTMYKAMLPVVALVMGLGAATTAVARDAACADSKVRGFSAATVFDREPGKGPRGEGEGGRGGRKPRLQESPADLVIAREPGEGPRGADNDRRRGRGGRNTTDTADRPLA